ncbi:hypothetical protein BD560DRAFT_408617 [Blakeslea trispora]|nr:hypothetical protein BD560DRAFT_408617 [Blakeslea trispora]
MNKHHTNFKRFIRRCKDNDIVPSFEDYLKSDKKYILSVIESGDKPEFSSYYRMFVQSASELNVTAIKGNAKLIWDEIVTKKVIVSKSKTLSFKEKLVFCHDHGPSTVNFNKWCVDGTDLRELLVAKRMEAVELVRQGKPVKESLYLLLSCVLDVPSDRSSFVLKVDDKTFKKIRRVAGCLPSLYFSADLMTKFFEFNNARKREKEREEEEEEEEEQEQEEEADEILSKIYKKCKKDKNEEGLALVAITRRFIENDSWGSSTTEESFIDQHLLPFVQVIFMNDRTYVHSRSAGRIPLSNSSHSASDGKDTCSKLKPDFCVMHEFQGSNVGLLAIEVRLPGACSSQALSDRSKLALELKRMIDQQVISGSRDPKSFGVLVEGFECTFFSCSINDSGSYVFGEVEKRFLLKNDDDLMLIPDLVLVFMKLKRAMNDSIAQLMKKQKAEQSTVLTHLIKQTVELPTKASSSSCI